MFDTRAELAGDDFSDAGDQRTPADPRGFLGGTPREPAAGMNDARNELPENMKSTFDTGAAFPTSIILRIR